MKQPPSRRPAWPVVRTRKKKSERAAPSPKRTLRPWAGYTARDMKREEPLAVCPSPRCRRAKACLAALDNLYCRRTHHGAGEVKRRQKQSPLQRALDFVMPVVDPTDMAARMERIKELAEIRRDHEQEMKEKWRKGAFDHLYGPYRAQGVILAPPARAYVEEAK